MTHPEVQTRPFVHEVAPHSGGHGGREILPSITIPHRDSDYAPITDTD
jgi:hypothetical protein